MQAAETTTYYEWDDAANEAKKIELSVEEGIALSDKYGKMIGDAAITLGDEIAFVGVKPELNAITGHQLAEQSPYKYTLLAGFLNGDQKYMPDEEAYDIQSWEFKRSGFGRGCAEEFVNVAIGLLDDHKEGIEHKVSSDAVLGNMAFKAAGGNDTVDRIFLLSAEEMQQYLEGSGHMIAIDASNAPAWYSLRTMGEAKDVQACVTVTGEIDLHGPNGGVANEEGGLRPAMWIRKY